MASRLRIQSVSTVQCFHWLARGWQDYRRSRSLSLAYGMVFVVAGYVLTVGLWALGLAALISPMIAGFLLVGPLLGVGLCEISRTLERGERPTLGGAFLAWRCNPAHILTAGLVVMLFLMIWVRIAVVIYAVTFPYTSASLGTMVDHALTSWDGLAFGVTGVAVGFAFASVAFVFGAVSLPLMLDRREDIFAAAGISFLAVIRNRRAMALWAALIVLFIGAGLATAFLGLAVTLPLIGHATWHAYRDLVTIEDI